MDADARLALLERARGGDERALAELFQLHEARLLSMVELRLDPTLRRRLDPADIVQEAWLEVARRFGQWCAQTDLSFHVWVRLIAAQALAQAQRRHLAAHMRDALREVPVASAWRRTNASVAGIADAFVATATSPSQAAGRAEVRVRVLQALGELDDLDREIVALRHFEGLSNEEAAVELAITPAAASKRFVRALLRLRPALEALAGESAAGGA